MRDYPTGADESKNSVAVHVPSSRWSIPARHAQTWWRNPNARGIAEPDPRTVARGRRAPRALTSPCPYSKRRGIRERKLNAAFAQLPALVAQLAELARVWHEPARALELLRELTAAEAARTWILTDPTWEQRTYERRTPLLLPRRADPDATRFLTAFRAARRFLDFADRLLGRERDERMRALLPALRPDHERARSSYGMHVGALLASRPSASPPEDQPITRRPDERRDILPNLQPPANTQGWQEIAARIAAKHFAERPDDAM